MSHSPASRPASPDARQSPAASFGQPDAPDPESPRPRGEQILAASPLSVSLYDGQGRLVAANAAYERTFGLRIADVPRDYSLLTDPQLEASGIAALIRRAYAGEAVRLPAIRYDPTLPTGGAGRPVWVEARCFPVRHGAEGEAHVALVHVDVTEWAEVEHALREATALLESRNAQLESQALELELTNVQLQEQATELEAQSEALQSATVDLEERTAEAVEARAAADDAARRLAAVLDALPDAAAVYDAEWRYTFLNPAARRLHAEIFRLAGVEAPPSAIGRSAWELFPWLVGTRFDSESRRAVAERRTVEYVEWAAPLGQWLETRIIPTATGAISLNRDVTEQVRGTEEREQLLSATRVAADRAQRLQRLTARLNEATSREQIADAIFEGALSAVRADAGAFALVHRDASGTPVELEVVRVAGYAVPVMARWRRFPYTPGRPLSEAVERREIVAVASPDEWRRRWPDAPEDLTALGHQAFAAVPVVAGERAVAALSFSFVEARELDDGARTFLATVAEQCALALERQRLHDSELRHAARHAALLETIRDPFVALDRDLRYTYVNAQAESALRRPAAVLLGRTLPEVFPEVEGSPFLEAIRRALETGHTEQVEELGPTLQRWIEARIHPAPDGISIVFRDVTARRREQEGASFMAEASRLLAQTLDWEATMRVLADAAVPRLGDWCAVDVVRDPAARTWPPTVERLVTVHPEPAMLVLAGELAERYPTDWTRDDGLSRVLRAGEPLFVPEVTDEMLVAGARDDGHLALMRKFRFGSIIIVPLVARGLTLGALTLVTTEGGRRYDAQDLALAEDLASRAAIAVDNARLLREAEEARARAEEANRAKAQFLATMSHELRTPLNAIQGHVQLLEMEVHGPVTPPQREALERVDRAQRHLLGLISDILGYARLESGRIEYDVRAERIADVLQDVTPMVEPQLQAKGVRYVVEVPEAVASLRVRADREKLVQVLLNLLSNATKFTPAGGCVTIAATHRAGEDTVRLAVSDTGIGIPPDKLEAIFEPFVQVRDAYAPGAGGTGLGLTISRDLARGMGGDLAATSVPGEGATFTVTLRVAEAG